MAYHYKTGDDGLVIPRLCLTAPLEGEEEGSDSTEREDRAEPIERFPLLERGHAFVERGLDRIMRRKPNDDGGNGNSTKRKIDVKAPAPSDMVRESATEEGTDDACDGENTTKATEKNWTVF